MDRGIAVRAALKAGVFGVFIGMIPFLGIVLTGAGTFLVLYSKEEAEKKEKAPAPQPQASVTAVLPHGPN